MSVLQAGYHPQSQASRQDFQGEKETVSLNAPQEVPQPNEIPCLSALHRQREMQANLPLP